LEAASTTDTARVPARRGDRHGDLVFNRSARNFSPLAAMAGRVCIAQVEEVVEPGEIDPNTVHLPGVYVHRVEHVRTDIEKRIERRKVAQAPSTAGTPKEGGPMALTRQKMAARDRRGACAPRERGPTVGTCTSASASPPSCRTTCRRGGTRCCSPRTESSAWGATPQRTPCAPISSTRARRR